MVRKQTRCDKYAGGFLPGMEAFQNLPIFSAMICGMEGLDDFELFAKLKEFLLRAFLKLPHGTPSDDPSFSTLSLALGSDAAALSLKSGV